MPFNIIVCLMGLFVMLSIASTVVFVLKKIKPQKDYKELSHRVKSWWIMIIIFSLAMILSKKVSILFFGFLSFLALKEYLSMIPTRRADHRVLFWAYLSILIQYYWVYSGWYGMFLIFIPLYVFLLLPLRMVLIGQTQGFLNAAGTLHWGLMTTVYSISHVSFFLVMPKIGGLVAGNGGWVLYLVFLTQFNDVAQYITGKTFGKHKIIPKVSPNKTYEGFFGGVIVTCVLAYLIAPILTPLSPIHSIIAGLIISTAGFIGDVVISALKRDLGLKDSGAMLPGHGGILDRIDSLTYTAPLFFHFVRYLYY
ncbi:MAG: phosphatidate cytidylyltransferase [Candidatus Omnitrophica bacterium]|nr:phosphatidate cytidylyltransferase [Candidatus Omnitrophota bacterium]